MIYVFLSHDCYPLPIAKHLLDEGEEVVIGMLNNLDNLEIPDVEDNEEPEDREERLADYDGLLDKESVDDVLGDLESIPDNEKDEYFFFFDYNYLYPIAEKIMKMGFKNGLFPTKEAYLFEKDRAKAKEFVKKNYPKVKVAESVDFDNVEDGIEHIENSTDVLVLKANGVAGATIVPKTDDLDIAKRQLIKALETYQDDYETGGFLLEKKIPNCYELTPVIVFYNGKYVYSLVEFENKPYGSGNIGTQKGGNQVLNIITSQDCQLNKIAFPPIIYEMAKKQTGLAIYDAGLLYDGKDFWFSEYCGQRFGWDGFFANAVMRDEGNPFVADFFDDIINGRNPLRSQFGAALRLFNYEGDQEDTEDPVGDEPIEWDKYIDDHLFLYNVNEKDGEIVCTANNDFVGCIANAGNTMEEAVGGIYEMLDKFYFDKLYYRPDFDFLSKDYKSSIPNRLEMVRKFLQL